MERRSPGKYEGPSARKAASETSIAGNLAKTAARVKKAGANDEPTPVHPSDLPGEKEKPAGAARAAARIADRNQELAQQAPGLQDKKKGQTRLSVNPAEFDPSKHGTFNPNEGGSSWMDRPEKRKKSWLDEPADVQATATEGAQSATAVAEPRTRTEIAPDGQRAVARAEASQQKMRGSRVKRTHEAAIAGGHIDKSLFGRIPDSTLHKMATHAKEDPAKFAEFAKAYLGHKKKRWKHLIDAQPQESVTLAAYRSIPRATLANLLAEWT